MTFAGKFWLSYIVVLILVGVAGFFAGTAEASTFDVNGLYTKHFNNDYNYNNNNGGVGYTGDIGHHVQWAVGGYNNSYNATTFYTGLNLKHEMVHSTWGVFVGVLTGYDDIKEKSNGLTNLNPVQFVISPYIAWKITKQDALKLTVIPNFERSGIEVASIQYNRTVEWFS